MRKRIKKTMRLVNFEIEEENYIRLKRILYDEGMTISGICRKEINRFIKNYQEEQNKDINSKSI